MAGICDCLRNAKESLVNPAFYDFEYQMLRLAGYTDKQLENAYSLTEFRPGMQKMWKEHYKDFECRSETNIFPKGNYFRQLAVLNAKRPFLLLLRAYKLDPNVIDADGCTALDFLEVQITRTDVYTEILIEQFKTYAELLRKAGAKTAKELTGCGC